MQEKVVAEVTDLETYRQLLKMRFYMEWRQTLDSDMPFAAYDYELFIVTPETRLMDEETAEFIKQFLGRGDDAFHFNQ